MVSNFKIITGCLWLLQILYFNIEWLYWLQIKEYRIDRFRSFFLTHDGRFKLKIYYIFTISGVLILSDLFHIAFISIILLSFIDLWIVKNILNRKIRKPVFTQRAVKIIISSLTITIFVLMTSFLTEENLLILASGEILSLTFLFLGIEMTLSSVQKTLEKEKLNALEKLQTINPIVIGVTGSYGKTTTKDFLYQILKKQFRVEKTEKNQNTEFGVIRKINKIENNTEILVVEMGAYKKGEIKSICKIVKPEIGIITGIEPQHLDLFGSMQNIMDAKYELIENLKRNGVGFFNLSNGLVEKLYDKAKKSGRKIFGYKESKINTIKNVISDLYQFEIIGEFPEKVRFKIIQDKLQKTFDAPLIGSHLVENLTGAIAVARYLKISWKNIKSAVGDLSVMPGTMSLLKLSYGAVVVDDTYNATPKGFLKAIEYLKIYKGRRKALITSGIIELGNLTENVHKNLGRVIDNSVDKIIVINKELGNYIKSGMLNNKSNLDIIEDTDKLIEQTEKLIERGDIILLEGRLPGSFMNFIESRKIN